MSKTLLFTLVLLLSVGCHEAEESPEAPAEAPPVDPSCVPDVGAHATADALARYGLSADDVGEPTIEPLRPMGEDQVAPFDLDGDRRPETSVSFPNQYGAYARTRWVYGTAGECPHFLGAFDESYLWLGTASHNGLRDLLTQNGADELEEGGGTMTRLVFDGNRYVPRGSVSCPPVGGGARDDRCPAAAGRPGRWLRSGAWNDGARPATTRAVPTDCVQIDEHARANAEGELERVELADIDGDGAEDVAFSDADYCGSAGCAYQIYVTNHGCARHAGTLMGGTPRWDRIRRQLDGGWIEEGACAEGPHEGTIQYHRIRDAQLVVARSVHCPCPAAGVRPAECDASREMPPAPPSE